MSFGAAALWTGRATLPSWATSLSGVTGSSPWDTWRRCAKRVVEAKGLTVAPGFIDMHNHSDYTLIVDGNAQSMIRQGVTSMILGEGESAGPIGGRQSPEFRRVLPGGGDADWDDFR